MYKIKIASYKHSKSLFWKLIRIKQRFQDLWNHSKYSHSEIVFEYSDLLYKYIKENNIWFQDSENIIKNYKHFWLIQKHWLWFSSSEQDWGTRLKTIIDNNSNWDYEELEVSEQQYLLLFKDCIKKTWYRYWWLAIIFTQILKTFWFKNKKAPFCSQVVIESLQSIWLFAGENSIEISPWKLSQIISDGNLQRQYNKLNNLYNYEIKTTNIRNV